MRIAINEALMNLRQKRRSAEVSMDESSEMEEGWSYREMAECGATPEEICSQQELRYLLDGMIERLGPIYRIIVQLRYVNGFSTGEVSRWLGIPIATVRTRLHRARLQLREMFIQRFPESSVCLSKQQSCDHFPGRKELRASAYGGPVARVGLMSLIIHSYHRNAVGVPIRPDLD
jgi:hypothetical protein